LRGFIKEKARAARAKKRTLARGAIRGRGGQLEKNKRRC